MGPDSNFKADNSVVTNRIEPSRRIYDDTVYKDPILDVVTRTSEPILTKESQDIINQLLEEAKEQKQKEAIKYANSSPIFSNNIDTENNGDDKTTLNLRENLDKSKLKYWRDNQRKVEKLLKISNQDLVLELESYLNIIHNKNVENNTEKAYKLSNLLAESAEIKQIITSETFGRKISKMSLDRIKMKRLFDKKQKILNEKISLNSDLHDLQPDASECLKILNQDCNQIEQYIENNSYKYNNLSIIGQIIEAYNKVFGNGIKHSINKAKLKLIHKKNLIIELEEMHLEILNLNFEINTINNILDIYDTLNTVLQNHFSTL